MGTYMKIAVERCPKCGAMPKRPHALICYSTVEMKAFEKAVRGVYYGDGLAER